MPPAYANITMSMVAITTPKAFPYHGGGINGGLTCGTTDELGIPEQVHNIPAVCVHQDMIQSSHGALPK